MTRILRATAAMLAAIVLAVQPVAAQSISATGTITINGATIQLITGGITLPDGGWATVAIQVTGTWTGTLSFEGSVDAVNFQALNATATNGSSAVGSTTANGIWTVPSAGLQVVRVRATAAMTGTASIYLRGNPSGGAGSGGGGSGSNAAAGATGAAVPSSASYTGLNIAGNLVGATGKAVGSEKAITVAIVDAAGTQITAFSGSGGTASNFGSVIPSAGTAAGASDGTNMQLPRVFDADSGAGTQYVLGATLRKTASGGTVEAGTSTDPLRVDPTGTTTQPVSDGGGSLTVDGAVTISSGSITVTQGTASSLLAQVFGGAAHDAPTSGNPVLFGGYASAAAPTDVSADADAVRGWFLRNGAQAIQQTFAGSLAASGNGTAGTTVQRVTLASDSTGQVTLASGASVTATQATAANLNAQVVGVAAADAAVAGNPVLMGGYGSSAVPTSMSTNGDVTRPWLTLFGAENAMLRDSVGDSAMDDTNNALRVNIVAGAAAGGTSIIDDAAFTVASTAVTPVGGTYKSTLDAVDDGDAGAFAMTARRAMHNTIRKESDGSELGAAAAAPFIVRLSDGSSFISPASDATHDSAAAATGPQTMAEAASDVSANTAVGDGDAVRLAADLLGRVMVVGPCDRAARIRAVTTITDGSSTSAIAASGAGIYNEIFDVVIANTSATAVTVDLRDGTAGAVLATFPVPANTAGIAFSFTVPITSSSNTAIAVDPSASATSIITTLSGCKAK